MYGKIVSRESGFKRKSTRVGVVPARLLLVSLHLPRQRACSAITIFMSVNWLLDTRLTTRQMAASLLVPPRVSTWRHDDMAEAPVDH